MGTGTILGVIVLMTLTNLVRITWEQFYSKKLPLKWITLVECYFETNLLCFWQKFLSLNLSSRMKSLFASSQNPFSDLKSPKVMATAKEHKSRKTSYTISFWFFRCVQDINCFREKLNFDPGKVSMRGPFLIIILIILWGLHLETRTFWSVPHSSTAHFHP